MTTDEAKEQLQRVFLVYPSFREYVNRESGDPPGTLAAWCAMLEQCDRVDVVAVIDGMVSGDIEPRGQFEKPAALPRTILREARTRRAARTERNRVQSMLTHPKSNLRPETAAALDRFRRSVRRGLGAMLDSDSRHVRNRQ